MSVLQTRQIVSTPDVLMGKPRLDGRRVGVHLVIYRKLVRGWSDEQVMEAYQLERAEIYAALAYYYDHQAEIDAIIADLLDDDDNHEPDASELLDQIAAALTTAQVAQQLGITERGVRNLIDSGTLPARKIGKQWFIDPEALELPEVRNRKPGRPTNGT